MTKTSDNGFKELYFITSKKSHLNGKTTYFENNPKTSVCYFKDNNSVTLIGNVPFVEDKVLHEKLWLEVSHFLQRRVTIYRKITNHFIVLL